MRRVSLVMCALVAGAQAYDGWAEDRLTKQGVITLDFQPAFLEVEKFHDDKQKRGKGLVVSSFYNTHANPAHDPTNPASPSRVFFERDLVARIPKINKKAPADITAADVEVLTDQHLPLGDGTAQFAAKTIWPNEAAKVPEDTFDFEALVVSQGFHSALRPGRVTLIDLSNKNSDGHYPEYIVHETTAAAPKYYHNVVFVDMNDDGRSDIVTVRSLFKVGQTTIPPAGELVWFEHPENYDGSQSWTEHVVFQRPYPGQGPDIHLSAADLDGDGVVEIIATHFFTGDIVPGPPGAPPMAPNGQIVLYGVPEGFVNWVGVGYGGELVAPRSAILNKDQGWPFGVELVDLNGDCKVDILATNHQASAAFSATPGRVYAIEQPADGLIYESAWTTRVLFDGIYPNANLEGTRPPGRLAPGHAHAFHPRGKKSQKKKPWILVSGDEAGKVWMMRPKSGSTTNWEYESAVIFDINVHYGADTSQTLTANGITISTIGKPAITHGKGGWAEIYIPVFEAKQIHVFRMNRRVEKIALVGDSITFGYSSAGPEFTYPGQLQHMLGEKYRVVNLGINGACMQSYSDRPWVGTEASRTPEYTSLVDGRWDSVVIMLGTNDARAAFFDPTIEGGTNWRGGCTGPNALDCAYAQDAVSLIQLARTLGRNGAGSPKVLLANVAPLMQDWTFGMNQTAINTVLQGLIPQIGAAVGVEVIDVFDALGGNSAPFPDGCTLDNEAEAGCIYFCSDAHPGGCDNVHPNHYGYHKIAHTVKKALKKYT